MSDDRETGKEGLHEPDAVPVRNILLFTIAPAIAIAVCLIGLFAFFVSDVEAPTAQEVWDRRPGEGPRLSARPAEVRQRIEVRDAAWLARGPGIEAAMAQTAEAGWREGAWPSRAYEALELNDAPEQRRTLPRESDLRDSRTEPRSGTYPETRDGANARLELEDGEGPG